MDIIEYKDFEKVKMVLGTITEAEIVPKSAKLIKLTVSFGELGVRQIVSGIKEFYPEADGLVGVQAVFLVNLQPREIFGLKSEGMLLGAQAGDNFSLLRTDKKLPDGSLIT